MSTVALEPDQANAWRNELRGFVRAVSGAFLFGIPLLYTMEMWWLGQMSRPGHSLMVLSVALAANAVLVVAAGRHHGSIFTVARQALRAVAVGAIASALVLLTLNQLTTDQSAYAILGQIIAQVLPLSLGAALADIVFSGGDREGDAADNGPTAGLWYALLNDVSATAIGAVVVSAAIAPTDEVPMIASHMDYWHLLALIGLTLLTGYIIVFASDFDPSAKRDRQHLFQHPVTETVLAYLVALVVSFGILLLAHQVSSDDPARFILTQTLVLALPAMIGGAAGRIAI